MFKIDQIWEILSKISNKTQTNPHTFNESL